MELCLISHMAWLMLHKAWLQRMALSSMCLLAVNKGSYNTANTLLKEILLLHYAMCKPTQYSELIIMALLCDM